MLGRRERSPVDFTLEEGERLEGDSVLGSGNLGGGKGGGGLGGGGGVRTTTFAQSGRGALLLLAGGRKKSLEGRKGRDDLFNGS